MSSRTSQRLFLRGRTVKAPENYTGLVDIRKAIDRTNLDIVQALGHCTDYVKAAPRFKTGGVATPAPERVVAMPPECVRWAKESGLDTPLVKGLFVQIIHRYTARQIKHWYQARGTARAGWRL